jgi:hypothetical protein
MWHGIPLQTRGFRPNRPGRAGTSLETTKGMARNTGISNRESPDQEARERREHPPLNTGSPEPEDAAGDRGEHGVADTRDRHTSHKAGSRSIAQKESESKYADRSMPASRKVEGAFGREPHPETTARNKATTKE